MATLVDPAFRARLQALGDKYAATVPGLMAAIGQALQQCEGEGGAPSAASLAALQKQLHTIAGSAGTFGFGALGGECRRLEQQARSLRAMAEAKAPSPDASTAVAAAWPTLAAEVRQLLDWAAVDARAPVYVPAKSV